MIPKSTLAMINSLQTFSAFGVLLQIILCKRYFAPVSPTCEYSKLNFPPSPDVILPFKPSVAFYPNCPTKAGV